MAGNIQFPEYSDKRCLMMPYIQGDPESVPIEFREGYEDILETLCISSGDIGFLTIDESIAKAGKPHRGARAKYGRALHTEGGKINNPLLAWGRRPWGGRDDVLLDPDTEVLLSNSLPYSCAIWEAIEEDTSEDGDIGYLSDKYPLSDAHLMDAGEVVKIRLLTPHESLPVKEDTPRQFIRIVSSGVYGRAEYFTENPLLPMQ